VDRHVLKGQAILLVEEQEQPDTARNLESALERFGTEVVPPQRAVEAIERLEEFDFSLASLDWSPDSSEHSAVARRLKEGGARFLFCPKQLPEEVPTRRGASSSQRPPHPRRSSNPPRSLPTRRNRSKRCAWGMARIRQEPRSTGQAYAARVGICAHILNVRGKWAVQLEVQRIELWTYSRSLLTSAGAPLRVLSGGCPYSAREFAKTYS